MAITTNRASDIVERLRCFEHPNEGGEALLQEAADEITRLRKQRDELLAGLIAGGPGSNESLVQQAGVTTFQKTHQSQNSAAATEG